MKPHLSCAALVLASAFGSTALAGYTYTDFTVAGAADTILSGINNAGTIVGTHGAIDVTQALKPGWQAFYANAQGTVTSLTPPGALASEGVAVNNVGTIVGNYTVDLGGGFQAVRGFVFNGSTYNTIAAPFPDATDTAIADITDEGVIVGSWSEDFFGLGLIITTYGFRATPNGAGGYSYESVDLAPPGALLSGTYISARNSAGHEVATLTQETTEGKDVQARLLPQNKLVRYSESTVTRLTDINNTGKIVGNITIGEEVSPNNFRFHAMGVVMNAADVLALPVGQVPMVDLAIPGTGYFMLDDSGLAVDKEGHRAVQSISDAGQIVGFYDNDDGIFRGFIGTPSLSLPGDFDGSLAVNAADRVRWEGDFGLNGESDADGDGDSDGADFLVWQRNIGGAPSAGGASSAVPEPCGAALLAGAMCVWPAARSIRARRLSGTRRRSRA